MCVEKHDGVILMAVLLLICAQTERTALHIAAHNRQPDIIAELLAAHAPSDAKDAQGAVPLHVAVATGDAATVAELLGRGNKVL